MCTLRCKDNDATNWPLPKQEARKARERQAALREEEQDQSKTFLGRDKTKNSFLETPKCIFL